MTPRRFEGTERYIATDDLRIAVNASVTLERPLLIKHFLPLIVEPHDGVRGQCDLSVRRSGAATSQDRFEYHSVQHKASRRPKLT